MNCLTCRHAYPLEPGGRWARHGFEGHVHCRLSRYGTAHIVIAVKPCTFDPPRWQERERNDAQR